jgi:hypothetical protein
MPSSESSGHRILYNPCQCEASSKGGQFSSNVAGTGKLPVKTFPLFSQIPHKDSGHEKVDWKYLSRLSVSTNVE